jgi:hypothetical protein
VGAPAQGRTMGAPTQRDGDEGPAWGIGATAAWRGWGSPTDGPTTWKSDLPWREAAHSSGRGAVCQPPGRRGVRVNAAASHRPSRFAMLHRVACVARVFEATQGL